MADSCLIRLADNVQRIEYCGLHVDLIKTSKGTVRIGSMPDISKFTAAHGFREEIVVVPEWECSMAGDNRTGEEFVLWQAQVKGGVKKQYTGTPADVNAMYRNLNDTFSFFFDPKRLAIIRKRWLNTWFGRMPCEPAYTDGDLEIRTDEKNVIVSDRGQVVYDRKALSAQKHPDDLVEETLAALRRDSDPRPVPEITAVGTGNGFSGTVANCLVRFDRHVLWIDPCGYPAHTLARQGVHWDDVTHVLVTHNHEDHTQGISACLSRAGRLGRRLNLLTAPPIHALLRKQFLPLFPDIDDRIRFIPLTPERPVSLGHLTIVTRWNHHFLPYGTLGLKISANGKKFGFSGDTKFDEAINHILNKEDLTPAWFADCDLVFHEVDFDNPGSVHSHWKQVQKIQAAINGNLLCYHTPFLANAPLPLALEGKTYCL